MNHRHPASRPNRAERRRHGHRGPIEHTHIPMIPGIVPDLTEESKQRAMDQAHEDLPDIPGTQVRVVFMSIDDGMQHLAEAGWGPDQIALLRDHAEKVGGTDPHVAVCMRQYPDGA